MIFMALAAPLTHPFKILDFDSSSSDFANRSGMCQMARISYGKNEDFLV